MYFVDGEFEPLDIVSYSLAPELPDVMKAPQDAPHVSATGETPVAWKSVYSYTKLYVTAYSSELDTALPTNGLAER